MVMDELEKSKAQDIVLQTIEEGNKLALSFMPGGAIIDSFLGYRSRLKQRRIIDFSESLKKVLEQFSGRELHGSDFEREDFVDIMESVYSAVQTTKSKIKLERLRNILARQIVYQSNENEMTIKFIQFVEQLTDTQLLILHCIDKLLIQCWIHFIDTLYKNVAMQLCTELQSNKLQCIKLQCIEFVDY